MLLVPVIGIEVKGSQRWLDLFILPRLQPIELVKPFLIVILSLIISSKKYSNLNLKYLLSFAQGLNHPRGLTQPEHQTIILLISLFISMI